MFLIEQYSLGCFNTMEALSFCKKHHKDQCSKANTESLTPLGAVRGIFPAAGDALTELLSSRMQTTPCGRCFRGSWIDLSGQKWHLETKSKRPETFWLCSLLYSGRRINVVTTHSDITTGKTGLCELRKEKNCGSLLMRAMCPHFSGSATVPDDPWPIHAWMSSQALSRLSSFKVPQWAESHPLMDKYNSGSS